MIPDVIKNNIFWILTNTAVSISQFRLKRLQSLRQLVNTTAASNDLSFSKLSSNMQHVLKGKKLEAFRALLQQADYPDTQIIDDILSGLALTGPLPLSGVYPRKLRSATITSCQLRGGSKWTRRGLIAKVKSSGDDLVDQHVWNEALEEKNQGWLSGPFTEDQLCARFPDGFVASRRFGLKQGPSKIRSIDDFSESLVNASVSTFEKN